MMGTFMIYTPHRMLLGRSSQGRKDRRDMWHAWDTREVHALYWLKTWCNDAAWKTWREWGI